jgi:peptide-methionine (S)-S-oxide reductase
MRRIPSALRSALILTILLTCTAMASQPTDSVPSTKTSHATATLGGGCFWCLEALYKMLEGVEAVVSGYAGGHVPDPTYKQVCTGTTGHAEVIQISFNPDIVSFEEILDYFWIAHDPTTLNRQGNDIGTQYRSIILYHDEAQKVAAESAIRTISASDLFKDPIVTQVVPLTTFFPAEDYHQDYFANNPNQSYCAYVIRPKVDKVKKLREARKD